MTTVLWNFASFIIALGILVAVHEFGHFWVARKCGVRVERFSIGFGKSIWRRIGKDGTEYSIAMIPLGGYVKMLDSRSDDVPSELVGAAFDRQAVWKRSAIAAAGPAFNFLFAILALWLVFMLGVSTVKPIVGEVEPNSIVAQAGLQPGMELKSVSGVRTPDWQSVNMALVSHIGEKQLQLAVASTDSIGMDQALDLDLSDWNFNPDNDSVFESLGFKPYSPEVYTTLDFVIKDGPAARAGLEANDIIESVNGTKVSHWQQIVDVIRSHPQEPVDVDVERNGQLLTLTLIPDAHTEKSGEVIGFAGVAPKVADWPQAYKINLQYGPVESVQKAMEKTGQLIELTVTMLGKLMNGDVGLNNLSGPISIAKGAGTTAEYGIVSFLSFLALISVNLGIINLVPLPMLDGGHLLFLAVEAVLRRPVPERVQAIGYRIGGAIIFSLMMIAIFNDFARL